MTLSDSERRRRKDVLKLLLKDLDRPPKQPYPRTEREREQAAKDKARETDRELLTPLAACKLFAKSSPTVRRAIAEGHVYAPFTLDATAKPVSLIQLKSAIAYWGQHDEHLLNEMRDNGHTLGVSGSVYNVLSPTLLVTLNQSGRA